MNLAADEAKKFTNLNLSITSNFLSFVGWVLLTCGVRVFSCCLASPETGSTPAKSRRISQSGKILGRRVLIPARPNGIYRAARKGIAQRSGDHGLRWGRRSAMPKIICGSGKSSGNAKKLAKVLTPIAFLDPVLSGAKETGIGDCATN